MVRHGDGVAPGITVSLPWVRLAALTPLLSFAVPREAALGWEGNLCSGPGSACAVAIRQAGWPVTMVRDDPNLSAIGSFFTEDHWSLGGFVLNLAFYAGVLSLLRALGRV